MKRLFVYHEDQIVGTLTLTNEEQFTFQYADAWLANKQAFALSLSLPLQETNFGHLPTLSYFENLLPEGDIRKKMAMRHKLSESDPFEFLKIYGADCAGAVVVTVDEDYPANIDVNKKIEVSRTDIDQAVRKGIPLAEALGEEAGGYFSLAGAQDKVAILIEDNQFFIPTGGAPTSHILKPPIHTYKSTQDSVYNEYFCMSLAKKVGIQVSSVDVLDGEDVIPLFVTERFDRALVKGRLKRLHQQDFCQAQGMPSSRKYDAKGGPTLTQNYELIKEHSEEKIPDLNGYLSWLAFNLLIGNNDSHSKNLSFLMRNRSIKLAPFYDLVSTAIYPEVNSHFAFSINHKNMWQNIRTDDLSCVEKDVKVRPGVWLSILNKLTLKVEENLPAEVAAFKLRFPKIKTAGKIAAEIEKRIAHFRYVKLIP